MSNLHRRQFLTSLFAIPTVPIIGSFTFAQDAQKPPLTRDELNEQILLLAMEAVRVPCPNAFTALVILSAALDVGAEGDLTDHIVKWKVPALETEVR